MRNGPLDSRFASRVPKRGRLIAMVMAVALLGPVMGARANGECQTKAAYLYHVAKFVQWPSEAPAAPLIICVIGKSPRGFTTALAAISGKMVRTRRIVVTYINRIEEIGACDLLYVSVSEKGRVEQILAAVATRPILTISDLKGFAGAGGMIGFIPDGERVRFEINQRASHRSSLRISAQLLKLATTIVE